MRREILFRGKRTDTGEWVEGFYSNELYANKHYISKWYYGSCAELQRFEVIPETVGQYTGLTDSNGKRIFEGDFVKFAKNIYQIIFEVGSFAFYDAQGEMISKIGGINDHCYSLMNLYIDCMWEDLCAYDVEIIGNMHDNPELLE